MKFVWNGENPRRIDLDEVEMYHRYSRRIYKHPFDFKGFIRYQIDFRLKSGSYDYWYFDTEEERDRVFEALEVKTKPTLI